jgi:peroxiredoxin Q/BCP
LKDAVKVGDPAPDFELPSQSGERLRLSDFRGKKSVVLYFYPKDNTPGCTMEARAFRDSYQVFKDEGAEVIGVSSDSVDSHRKFSQDCNLPFILLSDLGAVVRGAYGVPSSLWFLPGRVTYIIDSEGTVRHIFSSQRPKQHVGEAMKILKSIDRERESADHKNAARGVAEHPA